MQKRELYVCDICGATYGSPDNAVKCELSHKGDGSIVDAIYYAGGEYPRRLDVKFSDGVKLQYQRIPS